MTAPSRRQGRTGHRGGDHGLCPRRRGARHEGSRSDPASPEWAARPWLQAADILGRSPRSIRRLRRMYQRYGCDVLFDRRRQTPSPKRAPVAAVEQVLRLYRERYAGFNVRHFWQRARAEHGVTFCYAFVKKALQGAGLVPKHRPRGRHRRRREPRPCFGELLHLDGSRHRWLALGPEPWLTLIVVVDDATKQVLHAELHAAGESTRAVMTALRAVFTAYGVPMALYTDRAHWAAHTPVAGAAADRTHRTQVGRALATLGIDSTSWAIRPRPAAAVNASTGPCRIGSSTSCGSPGSPPSRRPIATSASASCRPSMPSSGGRPRIPPRLRAAGRRGSRADPLSPGGAGRRPGQYRRPRRGRPAARQAARPPDLCRPPGARPPTSGRPPLRAGSGLGAWAPTTPAAGPSRPRPHDPSSITGHITVSNRSGHFTCQQHQTTSRGQRACGTLGPWDWDGRLASRPCPPAPGASA